MKSEINPCNYSFDARGLSEYRKAVKAQNVKPYVKVQEAAVSTVCGIIIITIVIVTVTTATTTAFIPDINLIDTAIKAFGAVKGVGI